jgi:hypothetical protein
MNLFYLYLGLDYDDYIKYNNVIRFEFQKKTTFINDYFTKKLRKLRFKTDGTFNMISIGLSEFKYNPNKHVAPNVLKIHLPFDRNRYEALKNDLDCSYFLEMMEQGFKKASKIKEIPLNDLLNIIEDFKKEGCKNQWLHKKKRFKEHDLEIILNCEYTSVYFHLVATFNQISTKKELVSGVVLSTDVGVFIHEGMYKDIFINDKEIVITDSTDSPRILINKEKIFKSILDFNFLGDENTKRINSFQL